MVSNVPINVPIYSNPTAQTDLSLPPFNGVLAPFNYGDVYVPGNPLLYQWGINQFEVLPFNVHEVDHDTATDWAHKEIAGAAIYREWVGENDETFHFRGNLFPYRIGGMSNMELFEADRRNGTSHMLIRGDGSVLGWFVCEHLQRDHTFLTSVGVGQQIAFEASLVRVPVPASATFLSAMWGTVVGPGG